MEHLEQLSYSDDELYWMGRRFYEGMTVRQDYTKARTCFEQALQINPDHLDAKNYLAYCYYYGREIEQDYAKAFALFSETAEAGSCVGLYKLGDMYLNGYFVEQNKNRALGYYYEALEEADTHAPETPGICLRISDRLLEEIEEMLEKNPENTDAIAERCLEASQQIGLAEPLCWDLLVHSDPYAHLSLNGLIRNSNRLRKALAKITRPSNSLVFYPKDEK